MTENRFYPDILPAFEHEPTRDRFEIVKLDDNIGEGVKTLVAHKKGDIIFGFTGFFVTEISQFSLQVVEGLHLHDPFFMGKVLHACDANASCDMQTRQFTALRDIAAGEFITMDYAETEDYLFKTFPCSCGAENCRGYVTGRKQEIPKQEIA